MTREADIVLLRGSPDTSNDNRWHHAIPSNQNVNRDPTSTTAIANINTGVKARSPSMHLIIMVFVQPPVTSH
jgi:hypothetical protein